MSYQVKQGNIFGRIGTALGKGLAESIPQEVERNRLAYGLDELNSQKDLSPFEKFSKLASTPGTTPQIIQSGSDLLRQEARGKALIESQNRNNQPNPFQKQNTQNGNQEPEKHPSITKGNILEKVQEGYIPPTIEERDAIAGDAFNSNPAFFGNDPQKAIEWADNKIAQEEKIANAYETQHGKLTHIQDNVVQRLKNQSERLNAKVPAELYSRIEDEAIQATKPKKDGGRGLSEQEAMKEYGDKLNNASRDFEKINEFADRWGVSLRKPSSTLRSMKQTQEQMEKLGETDNYAKTLIKKAQVSPKFAYAVAEPVRRVPELNSFLKNLKPYEEVKISGAAQGVQQLKNEKNTSGTLEIAPKLAEFVKNNEKASPLAIAYELDKKNYDGAAWLQYLTDHSRELNLKQRQYEQTSSPINEVDPWNDWWLGTFTGVE